MWGQKGGMSCLVALEDGRLASGGSEGPIRIRPDDTHNPRGRRGHPSTPNDTPSLQRPGDDA